jgi:hypothetical protein
MKELKSLYYQEQNFIVSGMVENNRQVKLLLEIPFWRKIK